MYTIIELLTIMQTITTRETTLMYSLDSNNIKSEATKMLVK